MTQRRTCTRDGISIALSTCSGDPCWAVGKTEDPEEVWVTVLDFSHEDTEEDACEVLHRYVRDGKLP